jgi:hypothetical protein
MITKPKNGYKHVGFSDIINIACLMGVSATLMAILREVPYKGYISEFLNQCTYLICVCPCIVDICGEEEIN